MGGAKRMSPFWIDLTGRVWGQREYFGFCLCHWGRGLGEQGEESIEVTSSLMSQVCFFQYS